MDGKQQLPRYHHATLALLLVTLLGSGCAPVLLAAGAGAGYYAGNKKAARKVDRFFRELADSITTSSRRTSGARQTERLHGYSRGSGALVELQQSTLRPKKVARGEKVTVTITYAVMGAPQDGIRVRETRELRMGGRRLSLLRQENLTRKNGTWESTLVFRVPTTARKGTYEVLQSVRAEGTELRTRAVFTVR